MSAISTDASVAVGADVKAEAADLAVKLAGRKDALLIQVPGRNPELFTSFMGAESRVKQITENPPLGVVWVGAVRADVADALAIKFTVMDNESYAITSPDPKKNGHWKLWRIELGN